MSKEDQEELATRVRSKLHSKLSLPMTVEDILHVNTDRPPEDNNNLWVVFNRMQENIFERDPAT